MGFVIGATVIIWLLVVILAVKARPEEQRELITDQPVSTTVGDADEKSKKEHQP